MVLCLLFLPDNGKADQAGMRGGGGSLWWAGGGGARARLTRGRKGNGLGAKRRELLLVCRYRRRLSLVDSGAIEDDPSVAST